MARRRHNRRHGSMESHIVRDTTKIAVLLSPKACITLGILALVVFYLLIPAWFDSRMALHADNTFFPLLEVVYEYRPQASKIIGVGMALVCGFFAFRNRHQRENMSKWEQETTSLLARLLARFLN